MPIHQIMRPACLVGDGRPIGIDAQVAAVPLRAEDLDALKDVAVVHNGLDGQLLIETRPVAVNG